MATYIALVDFTEQGVRNFKDTTKRAENLIQMADNVGVKVKNIYWTSGAHDGIVILDAPDDETASAFLLSIATLGNVRTQTLRAFNRAQIDGIISKMA